MFGFDRAFLLEENRNLAAWPDMKPDRATLGALSGRFEAYFNDHFGFRKRLIHWLAVAKVKVLGVTSTPVVILGSNGWLYFGSESALSSYRALRPFSLEQLEAYHQIIEARRDWLAVRGIPYVLIILPNKDTIYPEFMPAAYNEVNPKSRLDQLLDYMKVHSSVLILDVREDLRRARRLSACMTSPTATGTCGAATWLTGGSCRLLAWFPDAHARPRSAFHDVVEIGPGGDLARMLGVPDQFPEERLKLEPRERWSFSHSEETPSIAHTAYPELAMATECQGADLPRAVLFRDSFAVQLIPFLAEHFERMLCIWDNNFDQAIIEHEHPPLSSTKLWNARWRRRCRGIDRTSARRYATGN